MPRGRIQEPEFRYYKFLNEDGTSPYQNYVWPLPTKNEDGTWEPGEWVTFDMDPILCRGGLHFVRSDQSPWRWIGSRLFEAEVDPENADVGDNKVAVKKARLIREIETYAGNDDRVNRTGWAYKRAGFNHGFGLRWRQRLARAWFEKKVPAEVRYYFNRPDRENKLHHKQRMLEARELHARASVIEKRITNERYMEVVREVATERRRIQAILDQLYSLQHVPLEAVLAGSAVRRHWYTRVPKKEDAIKQRIDTHERRRRAHFRGKTFAAMEAELGDSKFFFALVQCL